MAYRGRARERNGVISFDNEVEGEEEQPETGNGQQRWQQQALYLANKLQIGVFFLHWYISFFWILAQLVP
jgi:hypothetical protein